jgi:ArsR family transcriptional regulator
MKSPLPILATPARSRGRFARADRELAALARALGHPARVAILRLLTECGECMCGSIVDRLPLSQATVSQHLKVLKDAGLIQGEVEGPRVCYCIQPAALDQLRALLSDLRKH